MPPGKKLVVKLVFPLERVPSPIPPFTDVGAMSETSPLGVPPAGVGVTVAATVTVDPCMIVV
jgi:hypothetical protein